MMGRQPGTTGGGLPAVVAALAVAVIGGESKGETQTLITVNGQAVTQADLDAAFLIRGTPPDRQSALRRQQLERLVDEALITAFLKERRIEPSATVLDAQIKQLASLIRRRGEDPDELLARLGLDRQLVRRHLRLPSAWKRYVEEITTPEQLQTYFDRHRRELDGTQIRAGHILRKMPPEASAADWAQATQELNAVRERIQSGELSFEEAARKFSEAPSRDAGGDVGYFAHRGTMPAAFADAAFRLSPGELSPPVRTGAGLHLIRVTEKRPGQLSLEDVRENVIDRLSEQLWNEHVARLRSEARIIRFDAEEP